MTSPLRRPFNAIRPAAAPLRILTTILAIAWGGSGLNARETSSAAVDAASAALDRFRGNGAALRSFLAEMPAGGDLHNHLAGAVYAKALWLGAR